MFLDKVSVGEALKRNANLRNDWSCIRLFVITIHLTKLQTILNGFLMKYSKFFSRMHTHTCILFLYYLVTLSKNSFTIWTNFRTTKEKHQTETMPNIYIHSNSARLCVTIARNLRMQRVYVLYRAHFKMQNLHARVSTWAIFRVAHWMEFNEFIFPSRIFSEKSRGRNQFLYFRDSGHGVNNSSVYPLKESYVLSSIKMYSKY